MRIAFLGTSSFACPSLRSLAQVHDILFVITQPDRPVGRHLKLAPPPVKPEAARLGLSVIQPEKANEPSTLGLLNNANPELIVVAAYGQILRKAVLSAASMGAVNIHASLLPKYRGAAPINWAIIRGEELTGVTTMLMDERMDTGDILMKRSVEIGKDETAGELHDRLAALGAEVIVDTLDEMIAGSLTPTPQQGPASYAPKLTRDDGRIDWDRPAREIHNLVRGMSPWPSTFTLLGNERLKIHHTSLTGIARGAWKAGEISLPSTGRLLVATSDELIEITDIQRQSRPRSTGQDFLNGLRGQARFS